MLVLTRKTGEKIRIGDDITFMVLEIRANRVRIGIEAPDDVLILREELGVPAPVVSPDHVIHEREIQYAVGNS